MSRSRFAVILPIWICLLCSQGFSAQSIHPSIKLTTPLSFKALGPIPKKPTAAFQEGLSKGAMILADFLDDFSGKADANRLTADEMDRIVAQKQVRGAAIELGKLTAQKRMLESIAIKLEQASISREPQLIQESVSASLGRLARILKKIARPDLIRTPQAFQDAVQQVAMDLRRTLHPSALPPVPKPFSIFGGREAPEMNRALHDTGLALMVNPAKDCILTLKIEKMPNQTYPEVEAARFLHLLTILEQGSNREMVSNLAIGELRSRNSELYSQSPETIIADFWRGVDVTVGDYLLNSRRIRDRVRLSFREEKLGLDYNESSTSIEKALSNSTGDILTKLSRLSANGKNCARNLVAERSERAAE